MRLVALLLVAVLAGCTVPEAPPSPTPPTGPAQPTPTPTPTPGPLLPTPLSPTPATPTPTPGSPTPAPANDTAPTPTPTPPNATATPAPPGKPGRPGNPQPPGVFSVKDHTLRANITHEPADSPLPEGTKAYRFSLNATETVLTLQVRRGEASPSASAHATGSLVDPDGVRWAQWTGSSSQPLDYRVDGKPGTWTIEFRGTTTITTHVLVYVGATE